MDFEAWMASFKFDKNAYRSAKGAAKPSAQARPSRGSFQRQLLLTPPASPPNLALRRGRHFKTPSPPPTFIPSSSSSFSSTSTISEPTPLFTTDFFEVRKSPKGGYGAFATKDIEKDTIIMSEEPLFRAALMEVFIEFENLPADKRAEYRTLFGWQGVSDDEILAIFKTNRFETTEGKGGIFLKSSRFNHACHPFSTCTYSYNKVQGRLITITLQPIQKGEEITISYCGTPSTLYENYGFYCDCQACPPPAKAKAEADFYRGPR